MTYYIVVNLEDPVYNKVFLVKGSTKKEALDRVLKEYGEEYKRDDYKVKTVEEFYENREGKNVAVIG